MTNFPRGCRLLWLAVTTGWLIAATTALAGKASGITTDRSCDGSAWGRSAGCRISGLKRSQLIIDPPGQGQLPPWQRRTNVWAQSNKSRERGTTTKVRVLMTVICIVVFWMFMALRPAQAFGGCGSSWAICRYRIWVRHHTPAEYQARQQRIARTCTLATVWKDACH